MTDIEKKIIDELFPKRNFIIWEDIKSHSFYNQYDKMTRELSDMYFVTEDGRFGYGKKGLLISNTEIETGFFGKKKSVLKYNFLSFDYFNSPVIRKLELPDITDEDFNFLKQLKEVNTKYKTTLDDEKEKQRVVEEEKKEKRLTNFKISKSELINEFDKNGNGEVDIIGGNDFNLLLKKHQKKVIEIDRTYVQQFVKVSSYLNTKKTNVQLIFNSIKDTKNEQELSNYLGILKNEIHSYNLILFNSLNMIVSLVEDDMITFYEIHDSFDKLNMFNSNWENDVSQKLSNIGNGLNDLMYSIQKMGENIVSEISNLTYVTEESNSMLSDQLKEIGSSMETNNILTTIQTYQMYKINTNTKSLN